MANWKEALDHFSSDHSASFDTPNAADQESVSDLPNRAVEMEAVIKQTYWKHYDNQWHDWAASLSISPIDSIGLLSERLHQLTTDNSPLVQLDDLYTESLRPYQHCCTENNSTPTQLASLTQLLPSSPAQVEERRAITLLKALKQAIDDGSLITASLSSPQPSGVIQNLTAHANHHASAVEKPVIKAILAQLSGMITSEVKRSINLDWQPLLTQCHKALTRYPFNPRSPLDLSLAEFGELFGEQSVLLDLHQQSMASGENTLSPKTEKFFLQANHIHQAFYTGSNKEAPLMPNVHWTITPGPLDKAISEVNLVINDTVLKMRHGSSRGLALDWPSIATDGLPRVALTARLNNGESYSITHEGPWSWFRLLNDADKTINDHRFYTYYFTLGSENVVIYLKQDQLNDPLQPGLLTNLSCPERM